MRVSARMAKVSGLVLVAAAAGMFATGCETGRTSKQHSAINMISDETTTGKQDPSYVASGEGIPPVPGSPTAAGVDGKQPYNSGRHAPARAASMERLPLRQRRRKTASSGSNSTLESLGAGSDDEAARLHIFADKLHCLVERGSRAEDRGHALD